MIECLPKVFWVKCYRKKIITLYSMLELSGRCFNCHYLSMLSFRSTSPRTHFPCLLGGTKVSEGIFGIRWRRGWIANAYRISWLLKILSFLIINIHFDALLFLQFYIPFLKKNPSNCVSSGLTKPGSALPVSHLTWNTELVKCMNACTNEPRQITEYLSVHHLQEIAVYRFNEIAHV